MLMMAIMSMLLLLVMISIVKFMINFVMVLMMMLMIVLMMVIVFTSMPGFIFLLSVAAEFIVRFVSELWLYRNILWSDFRSSVYTHR